MPDSWQTILVRAQETDAVWQAFAPTFTVGELTLALHQADATLLPTRAQAKATQQDVVDAALASRDANFALLADLNVRLPRLAEGALAPDDPLHGDIDDIRTITGNSMADVVKRAQRVAAFWVNVNARRAAMAPVQGPLLVGTTTVAAFQAAVAGTGGLEQAVEDERAELNKARSALRLLAGKLDQANKRWFAAWEANFAIGSPEHDALSQIGTGPNTPPPDVPENVTLAPAEPPNPGELILTWTAGAHTTDYAVNIQTAEEDGFSLYGATVGTTLQIISQPYGATLTAIVTARNSAGETPSAPVSAVVPSPPPP